ncbi:hypothetical protein Scep_027669 [Stephania cephalantha]|uniref:Uncharacterized protein n=1 Tax=Stephania cephalantha TaxID=152367 RepID=A0AAP0HL05_9MAGN
MIVEKVPDGVFHVALRVFEEMFVALCIAIIHSTKYVRLIPPRHDGIRDGVSMS